MANATSTQLQELYVAYFGRAADPTGLDYWTAKGITQAAFAADTYAAPEFKSEFGSLSTESQVNQIYKNLFDREADVTGLNYWTLEINLGNLKVAEIATHLIWAAQNNDGSADDKTALSNRTSAAIAYTAKVKESAAAILAYAPTNDGKEADSTYVAGKNITEAKSYLSGIDKDTAHTDEGVAASVTTITTNGAGSGGGKNYVLTTGVDSMSGSTGADTFTGDNTGTINQSSAADTIDGGAGADTLNIFSDGTVDGLPELTSVETVNVYDKNDNFDVSGQSSITTLNQIRGEGDSLLTVGAGVAVGLENIITGTGTTLAGTTVAYNKNDTTASLTLNKITDAAAGTTDEDIIITGAKLTTLNLTTTGSESEFDALDVAAVKTINLTANAKLVAPIETTGSKGTITVTGTAIASIGTLDTGFTKVDASANTGGLTVTDAAAATIITGSATAADHVNVGVLAKTKAVTLGDGLGDRIEFTDDTQYTTTSAKVTGAEIARLAGTGSSYDLTRLGTGLTDIEVQTTAGTITLNKVSAAQASKISVLNSVTTLTTVLSDATGTADSLTVTIDDVDDTAAAITVGDITAASVETLNVVAGDTDSLTHIISDLKSSTSLKTLNVSGTANLTVTDMTDMASSATVDASGFAENLTVTTIGSGDTVLAGSGDDTVGLAYGSLGNTTKYSGGSGDDTLNVTGSGSDIVDADFALLTGVDNITIASATSASLTLSGYAQAAILTVDENTDGLLDITATALTINSTIDASAMIGAGVDATVTVTTAEGGIDEAILLTGGDSADKFTMTVVDSADTGGEDDINTTFTGNGGIDIFSYTETSTTSNDTLTVVSAETKVADADLITGFIGNDAGTLFDYNGSVQGTPATDVDTGATITAAIAVAGTQTAYVVTTDVANASTNTQGTAFNNVLNADASNLATHYAELETQLLATNGALNGSITSLDADITASEAALIILDNGTGSVVMRVTNTTASGNTILATELDLVAVMTNATGIDDTDFM